jgi:hypothetical protein
MDLDGMKTVLQQLQAGLSREKTIERFLRDMSDCVKLSQAARDAFTPFVGYHEAFASLGDVASWTKSAITITSSAELSADALAAIAEVSEHVDTQGRRAVKVKLHSKTAALQLLTKHLTLEQILARLDAVEQELSRRPPYGIA